MKKLVRVLVLIPLCGLLVLLVGFLALGMYYRNNFPVNTWINGVYCTGKSIDQVNRELVEQTEIEPVVLLDMEGQKWQIDPEEAGIYPDYTAALKAYLRQNATVLWMENLHEPVEASLDSVQYKWDEESLQACFGRLSLVQKEEGRPEGCFLQYDPEEGYSLYDGNRARLNSSKALAYVQDGLSRGELQIDLRVGDCYEDLGDSEDDLIQRALWNQVLDFYGCNIVYDMGAEQIQLSPAVLSTFLKADDSGRLLLDERGCIAVDREAVEQWVEDLAKQYDTCDTVRDFQSTRGDIVSVQYVTYGTKIDRDAEKEYLFEALNVKRENPEIHIPSYKQEGFTRGMDDIGDTYIEVDMTQQHMYYYVDGRLELDTDIVTGNTGRRMGTPEGINYVYNKQRNRVLRGADYATPVKYWMPVKGAVGIHDASWRREFGGEIYKRNGSHGCINTPSDVMAELYDMVEVGTPVIMFY